MCVPVGHSLDAIHVRALHNILCPSSVSDSGCLQVTVWRRFVCVFLITDAYRSQFGGDPCAFSAEHLVQATTQPGV